MHFSLNQYHGATEVIDENLSENDGEENLKKLKQEADQINDDRYKNMDNKLREEKDALIELVQHEGEEKHAAEMKVKEKVEDVDGKLCPPSDKPPEVNEELTKLDTQLKGILKVSDSKQNVQDTDTGGVVQIVASHPVKHDSRPPLPEKPSPAKIDGAMGKLNRTLPQVEKLDSAVNKTSAEKVTDLHKASAFRDGGAGSGKPAPASGNESAQPKTHSVKHLVRSFERVSRDKDTLELPKATSVPENMSDRHSNVGVPRRQSEPSCNIVENAFPEHLISRAQLTFAIMQTDDRTHTMGDDNADENATRAAPFTQASQWQGVSGFASSTDNSENEEEAEEVVGGDGRIHKTATKTKSNRNLMHTLADEDDLKLDSFARNSMNFDDKDASKAMRNSLIFIDDDIEESPQEHLGLFIKEKVEEKSQGMETRDISFSFMNADKSRGSIADQSTSHIPQTFSVPTNLSDRVSDKAAKDLGNRINAPKLPSSPSKSSLKDKESLSDIKKLAVLNNLKLTQFGKISSSMKKERSSENLDKILSDKKSDTSSPGGSPAKTRHLLKPLDFLLKEKTKSDGDIAGNDRRSRSRSRDGKDRGRSSSRSDEKSRRRQSLTTIEEHRSKAPAFSPLLESVLNVDKLGNGTNGVSVKQNGVTPDNNKIITSNSNAKDKPSKPKDDKTQEEAPEKRERKSRKRSSSAPREKQENVQPSDQEPIVPPLDFNQKVPKPPGLGSAPKKNLVYSARYEIYALYYFLYFFNFDVVCNVM